MINKDNTFKLTLATGILVSGLLHLAAAQASDNHRKNPERRIALLYGAAETDFEDIDSVAALQLHIDADMNDWLGVRFGTRAFEKFETGTVSPIELEYRETFHAGVYIQYQGDSGMTPYLGMQYVFWELESNGAGQLLGKADGTDPAFSAGLRINLNPHFGANLEYGHMTRIDDTDIDYLMLGIYLRL